MSNQITAEFKEFSIEIPMPGYEGMRAITPEVYTKLVELQKIKSELNGFDRATQILIPGEVKSPNERNNTGSSS